MPPLGGWLATGMVLSAAGTVLVPRLAAIGRRGHCRGIENEGSAGADDERGADRKGTGARGDERAGTNSRLTGECADAIDDQYSAVAAARIGDLDTACAVNGFLEIYHLTVRINRAGAGAEDNRRRQRSAPGPGAFRRRT